MSDKLEQAREVVRRYPIPDALRRFGDEDLLYYDGRYTNSVETGVSAEVLARSLHYMIKLKRKGIRDESDVPLGASKHKGLPHLPHGWMWPRHQYFVAQFNLAKLHPFDIHDAFPASGMLYVFFDPGGDSTVFHYDGPLEALQVTPYPDSASKKFRGAKYYLDGFIKRSARVSYRPRSAFYLGGDAYDLSDAKKLIPAQLRREVGEILGARVTSRDTDCRIFGRPLYWQGEDERLDDEDDWHHEDDDPDGDANPDPDEDGEVDDSDEPRHLLFQDEFGEGHIHFWIDVADAQRRDYSQCWLDYSGT